MPIRIEHGKPSTLLKAAQIKGEERAAQQQLERTERLQAQQREFEYRTAIRQQDMAIDLQMQERAKLWEIDKMQLRSQMDFQREEQQRQRKLDSADNALQQIDKEVLAGRMTEQEAYPIKQKLELSKLGVNVPIGAFEERKVDPMEELLQRYLAGDTAPTEAPTVGGRVRVISPEGQAGTILATELDEYKARGFRVTGGEITPTKKPTTKKVSPKPKPYGSVYREWL